MQRILLIIISIFLIHASKAQEKSSETERLKIGLVLSGGGAKGFAHIGAIELLEETGIKPDYITGSSMGAIVGALYAMGYSVEEMKEIVDTTDWSYALSNNVYLSRVTMIEKPFYGNFLTEMDVTKEGVSLPGGLIEGQNLTELLSMMSIPVHGIDNFLKFPIPFSCIATDIVHGKPVALKSGNIVTAIRASMAIPSVFTPVEIDSSLYIDGGWTRNLPVQEAREMGADIIIAVDVGAPLKNKEELKSMISILDQTSWILSAQDTERQIKNSDFVISPEVGGFSTFAFELGDTIISLGYEEAAKQRLRFDSLAKSLNYGESTMQNSAKASINESFELSSIDIRGNKLTTDHFIEGRLDFEEGKHYSAKEISSQIEMLYGSLYYKKISFSLSPLPDSTYQLQLNLTEDQPAKLKLSLYYDSENSIGLNANLTLRNVFFRDSRFIVSTFISENPILDLKYLKYMGEDQHTFAFADFRFTKDSRFQSENIYNQEASFNYREALSNIGIAYTNKNNTLFGISLGYQGARATPSTNKDTIIDRWSQTEWPAKVFFNINTYNQAVFPSKGFQFDLDIKYNFGVKQSAKLRTGVEVITQEEADAITYVDPYLNLRISYQHYIPLSKNISLVPSVQLMMPNVKSIGFNDDVKVGGIAPILHSAIPFWGINRNEINVRQAGTLGLGLQWNMYSNLYLRARVNYLNTEYPMALLPSLDKVSFVLEGKEYTELLGFGLELAYNSPIGPVRFGIHRNQYVPDLNLFFGFGYNIFRSKGDFK